MLKNNLIIYNILPSVYISPSVKEGVRGNLGSFAKGARGAEALDFSIEQ